MSQFKFIKVPDGDKIGAGKAGAIVVPDRPIIGFIEGDGIGPDIWAAAKQVFDEAVTHCYGTNLSHRAQKKGAFYVKNGEHNIPYLIVSGRVWLLAGRRPGG